jgi:hypothetical protein
VARWAEATVAISSHDGCGKSWRMRKTFFGLTPFPLSALEVPLPEESVAERGLRY